jgi:hypothetical protein
MKIFVAGIFVTICGLLLLSCDREKGKFVALSPEKTNTRFNNTIIQDDSVNVFDFPNIFNGGGVGVGDFNNVASLPAGSYIVRIERNAAITNRKLVIQK